MSAPVAGRGFAVDQPQGLHVAHAEAFRDQGVAVQLDPVHREQFVLVVAESGRFQVEDGQTVVREAQKEVGDAGQDYAGLGIRQPEGRVVGSREGPGVTPPAGYPGREAVVPLEVRQDGPLGEGVYAAEDARHDGPGGTPAQLGPHPEASLATVGQGEDTEVFGGDSHGECCEALVRGREGGPWREAHFN